VRRGSKCGGGGGHSFRDGPISLGGDDGGLGHLEQTLDGLVIRLVTQLVHETEYRSAEGWHANPSAWKFEEQK